MTEKTLCNIDGCNSATIARGWCNKHWKRWRQYGDPQAPRLQPGPARKPLADAFWEKVAVGEPDECWQWTAATNRDGYGVVGNHPQVRANRLSYELDRGEIPEGAIICHTCDNKGCVNPRHLYAGTLQDNADDRWSDAPLPRPNPEFA